MNDLKTNKILENLDGIEDEDDENNCLDLSNLELAITVHPHF